MMVWRLGALLSAVFCLAAACFAVPAPAAFDVRRHLGTKRPYPFQTDHADPVEPPLGYEVLQLHLISRHGTRYPNAKDIRRFQALADHFRSIADKVPETIKWARNWTVPFPMELANLLAPQGELDLYHLGRRILARYPTLLKDVKYNSNVFRLRSSEVSRSGQSGSAFATGLFEGHGRKGCSTPVYITTMPKGLDQELAVKYACPRWMDEMGNNARRQAEVSRFMERRVSPVAKRMAQVLGRVPLTVEHVHAMYRLCGFLVAHYNETETWCSNFREEDMAGLEYVEDLDAFITYGYGSVINYHMGCPLASKLLKNFREAMDSESKPVLNAEFMFGHAETILFFATFMGFYRDPYPLTGNISDPELHNRRFRTSLFAPFTANYMFEIYRRLPTTPVSVGPDHLIRLLVNESPAVIPGIPQIRKGYYAADAVVDYLARNGACRFVEECETRESAGLRFLDVFHVQ